MPPLECGSLSDRSRGIRLALAGAAAAAGEAMLWIARGWAIDIYDPEAFIALLPATLIGLTAGIPWGLLLIRYGWVAPAKTFAAFVLVGLVIALGVRTPQVIEAISSGDQHPFGVLFFRQPIAQISVLYAALSFSVAGAIYWLIAFRVDILNVDRRSSRAGALFLNIFLWCVPLYFVLPVVFFVIYRIVKGPWHWSADI